jgi:hypothetical protein
LLTFLLLCGALFCAVSLFLTCTGKPSGGTKVLGATAGNAAIKPVPFPDNLGIPGFNFPEDSNTIYGWLKPMDTYYYDTVSVFQHAWGIWTGLTSASGQHYNQEELLVFETWYGPVELSAQVAQGNTQFGCTGEKSGRTPLRRPRQFDHASLLGARARQAALPIDTNVSILETVGFDPNAACFVTSNSLFKASVLNTYIQPGKSGSIPDFPTNAITIKPSFFLDQAENGLIRIPVWPGPPPTARAYGYEAWNLYVYADIGNQQPPNKKLVPTDGSDPSTIPAATCNLSDFIYFTLDSAAAAYANQDLNINGGDPAKAGDKAILVGMHVTTKETSNWTWQTFFWTPDPDNPPTPSSAAAAAQRPAQLRGAARHYAVATAYMMVRPNQPITGGSSANAQPQIGFNPYLEAGFSGLGNDPNWAAGKNFQYGIQTNCMSCHAMATYPGNSSLGYVADLYIGMTDPRYNGQVRGDFSWSLINNVIQDVKETKTQ